MKNVLVYYDDIATLEYNANRSLIEENKKLREELKKVPRERDVYLRDVMVIAISKPEEEEDTSDDSGCEYLPNGILYHNIGDNVGGVSLMNLDFTSSSDILNHNTSPS